MTALAPRLVATVAVRRARELAGSTAKTHVKRLRAKVGARNRAEAVIAAFESGLLRAGDAGAG